MYTFRYRYSYISKHSSVLINTPKCTFKCTYLQVQVLINTLIRIFISMQSYILISPFISILVCKILKYNKYVYF